MKARIWALGLGMAVITAGFSATAGAAESSSGRNADEEGRPPNTMIQRVPRQPERRPRVTTTRPGPGSTRTTPGTLSSGDLDPANDSQVGVGISIPVGEPPKAVPPKRDDSEE